MTFLTKPYAPLLALVLTSLPSCATLASEPPERKAEADPVIYEVPQPGQLEPEKSTPLKIAKSGEFSFGGETVAVSQLEDIASELRADGFGKIGVLPAKDTNFAKLVSSISEIAKVSDFEFVALDMHRRFKRSDAEAVAADELMEFTGTLGEFELPVLVGYSAANDQCIVSLGGEEVEPLEGGALNSEELYDRSFMRLDRLVQRSGGVEAILEKTDAGRDIIARIQAGPETPWHCIAGALYGVQNAGWPMVQFEVMRK